MMKGGTSSLYLIDTHVLVWDQYVTQFKTRVLPIRMPHVLYTEKLAMHHKDPYDRILIAQSVIEKMPLVTSDDHIRKYDIDQRSAS